MKKFQFELEEVLNFRKFEQQQAEFELGKALSAEKQIQDRLDSLAEQQISAKRRTAGSTDFLDITNASRFAAFVRLQSEKLMDEMAQAKIISDQKRQLLKKAMQNTDALEKLKEKQQEEYMLELRREEDKELDDLVSSRSGRN